MSDVRTTLERIERRVSMPEPAMERMLRRRERKERNERIAAVVVGLGVAAAGIVGAALALRVTGGTTPASGRGVEPTAEVGSVLLPTVAIWTALTVLGLTVLAAVRLRARLADVDANVEQEGREPGGAAASARRPATDPQTAPRKGGTEMDGLQTTGVTSIPAAEIPGIRFEDGKLRRANRWLTGAVVMLAVALVVVSTWAIVDRSSGGVTPTPRPQVGLADTATVAMIDALNEAGSTDGERFASFFAPNGVLEEGVGVTTGREKIARHMQRYIDGGFWIERDGPVIQSGSFVAHAFSASTGSGMVMYELTPDGEIQHLWAFLPG